MVRSLLFVGDSHLGALERAHELGLLGRRAEFCIVGGATALGLENENSVTRAAGTFSRAVRDAGPGSIVVTMLGEVDCAVAIWCMGERGQWRRLRRAVASYMAFVDGLTLDRDVVVLGVPPQTVGDMSRSVACERWEVAAGLPARRRMTELFNKSLEYETRLRGVPFVDITREVVEDDGVVRWKYRSPVVGDHHLDFDAVAPLWAARLCEALRGIGDEGSQDEQGWRHDAQADERAGREEDGASGEAEGYVEA